MTAKVTKNTMTPSLQAMSRELRTLSKEVYDYWVSITPKDTGNARRKTSLRGDVIHADYPYADRLDQGHSKQAPKGMSEPTDRFVENRLRQKMRK